MWPRSHRHGGVGTDLGGNLGGVQPSVTRVWASVNARLCDGPSKASCGSRCLGSLEVLTGVAPSRRVRPGHRCRRRGSARPRVVARGSRGRHARRADGGGVEFEFRRDSFASCASSFSVGSSSGSWRGARPAAAAAPGTRGPQTPAPAAANRSAPTPVRPASRSGRRCPRNLEEFVNVGERQQLQRRRLRRFLVLHQMLACRSRYAFRSVSRT